MVETTGSPEDAAAQRAAEQARLRKERREAKIKAGGSARLNKITGMAGVPRAADYSAPATTTAATSVPVPVPVPVPATTPAPKPAVVAEKQHGDPDEVDISDHYYEPESTPRPAGPSPMAAEPQMSEDQLRQLMLGFDSQGQQQPQQNGGNPMADDPIMKMMSEMMGGAGGSSPFGNMPNFQQPAQEAAGPDWATSLWRIVHAIVALGLGLYIVLLTPFTGSKIDRDRAAIAHEAGPDTHDLDLDRRKNLFFWTFATAETGLLTARFFLDKGRVRGTGIVHTVMGFLPSPYRGYAEIGMRYARIFTTVRADILACIFVLGVCAWWREE